MLKIAVLYLVKPRKRGNINGQLPLLVKGWYKVKGRFRGGNPDQRRVGRSRLLAQGVVLRLLGGRVSSLKRTSEEQALAVENEL
jgi:hypothetical protein